MSKWPRGVKTLRKQWPEKHIFQARMIMPSGSYLRIEQEVTQDEFREILAVLGLRPRRGTEPSGNKNINATDPTQLVPDGPQEQEGA